jgi:predicted ester cyclase
VCSASRHDRDHRILPATGRRVRFDVGERSRFVDGKLAERWAEVDIEGIKRQLVG